jgi:hypothetical protein
MAKKTAVTESAAYNNFVGQKNMEEAPLTLQAFFDEEITVPDSNPEWKKHWTGMPAFTQDSNEPYHKCFISFRNEEDYQAFAKLIGQNLSEKTKSIWYPQLDRTGNALVRWIEESEGSSAC